MVHQHFKLVECFTVLDNIILGVEPNKMGFLQKTQAREKVIGAERESTACASIPDALIEDISVGMQQRTEILKMLYRDNEILIFDEPTAVLTPQEIDELMQIMNNLAAEGKSILFISHKLAEIMAVADRCTVLRKGRYIGTVDTRDHHARSSFLRMMVGREVNFKVRQEGRVSRARPCLSVEDLTVASKVHKNNAVRGVSLQRPARRDRLHRRHRRQRPDRAGLRPDRSGARWRAARSVLGGKDITTRLHPRAQHHGHEPHPRRPAQARSRAGLYARGQSGAPALF